MADNKILIKKELYQLGLCILVLFLLCIFQELRFVVHYILSFHLSGLDLTHYPYLNPPIFFSIGEAVSSVAILLAIYQVRKEKWYIAFKVRSYIEPLALVGILLGIFFALISSIFSLKEPTNIFELSIFWQIISSLFVVASIAIVFWKANTKNLFNKRTSRKFYQIVVHELSRPTPERLDMALDTLLDNFEDICKSVSKPNNLEITQSAKAILDVVLSEASLVEVVTTKRLDALRFIIYVVEKYNINQHQAPGVQVIVRSLFLNESSFFYKHLNQDGLALSSNVYEGIFESPKILTNFNLFGYPTLGYSAKTSKQVGIKVFIESLSKAITTYLRTGNVNVSYINDGLEYLSNAFTDLCTKINAEEKRGVDTKWVLDEEWRTLHDIAFFIGHDYPFLAYQDKNLNQEVIQIEKTASEAGFNSSSTINAGIAALLYKAFEQLSYFKKSNDIYHIVLQLLSGMMHEENYKEGYRGPFEKRMWEQFGKNIVERYYPATLRSYLVFIGFTLASKDVGQRKGWIGEQTERMRKLLYVDLKPLFDKGEKMADDRLMIDILLPDSMSYKDGKFMYTMGFGDGPQVIISEPPVGSGSALENVDITSARSLL